MDVFGGNAVEVGDHGDVKRMGVVNRVQNGLREIVVFLIFKEKSGERLP